MKKHLLFAFFISIFSGYVSAQTYLPVVTTGYNLDAIAENTTALATTSGVIDGSNYVLYSQNYGTVFGGGTTYGLPNTGLISSGTRTYQLQSYTTNNVLYLTNAQADTLYFITPASYPSLSVLCFATEGTATMNLKIRFTDGTSQSFTSLMVDDWFNTANANPVITGIDRCSRPSGVPNYNSSNPRLFRTEINFGCANSLKLVQRLIVQNNSASINPRIVVMGVSGAVSMSFTTATSPLTCSGGSNGSATLALTGGVPPLTYTWGSIPTQTSAIVNLPAGVTNFTITDGSACSYTSFVNITQAIVPGVPVIIAASQNPICSGSTVTLTANGAATYTWSNNGFTNTNTNSAVVVSNTTYSIVATTSANCTLYGNLTVTVNPLPLITFTVVPNKLCINSPGIVLSATPPNGAFSGQGLSFGSFFPALVGVGTQTLSYSFTDNNNCTSVQIITTVIASPTAVLVFAVNPSTVCSMGSNITLTATPAGGTFSGAVGVSGAVFTPTMGIGTYTIMYAFTDANSCKDTKIASVGVRACQYLGLNELSDHVNFVLGPNPNNGNFYVTSDGDLELYIINELGQFIRSVKLNAGNNRKAEFDNLAAGVYIVQSPAIHFTKKVIVTK